MQHLRTNLTNADQPQSLALELRTHILRALPATLTQIGTGLWNIPSQSKHHRDRVLGGRASVASRHILDGDPLTRRGIQINVVDPDSSTNDDLKILAGVQELSVHLRLTAHDQAMTLTCDSDLFLEIEARLILDTNALLGSQDLDGLFRKLVGDEDNLL